MSLLAFSLLTLGLAALIALLGGAALYLSVPAFALLALGGIVGSFAARKSPVGPRVRTCLSASALFFGYILVRCSVSPAEYIARSDLYMVAAALIVYLSFAICLPSSRGRTRLVWVLLLIAGANFVYAGIQFFKGHNYMPFDFLPRADYGARASGFFGCPNHLAGYLEIVLLFSLSLACWSRYGLLLRIAAGYAALTAAVGILLTGSRGGYASSLAGLAVFGFLSLLLAGKWLRREFWYLVIATSLVAVGAVGFGVKSLVSHSELLQYRVESVNLDLRVRTDLTAAAWKQFLLSPWFGTGSRTYLYYGREFRGRSILADANFAHNDYAQLLGEYGLIGFAGFCVFLGAHLRNGWVSIAAVAASQTPSPRRESGKRSSKGSRSRSAWRAVEDDSQKRLEEQRPSFRGSNSLALTAGALSSVAAYLVHSLVDFNLHIPANTCVMAFVFSVLANPGATSTAASGFGEETPWRRMVVFQKLPAALGVWLLAIAAAKWPGEYHGEKAHRLLSDWRMLDTAEFATQAVQETQLALSYDPRNPELYYYLGESHVTIAVQATETAERTRLYEESVKAYQKALALAPQDVRYVLCLAWSFDALERFDEAESAFALALRLDPNSNRIHSSYAAHFQQQQKLEQAEAEYVKALKLGNLVIEAQNLEAVRNEIQARKTKLETPAPPPPN